MRFLIDNALSPILSAGLSAEGHDAVHVKDLGMEAASDESIFALARDEQRILVSADTDFGTLLALRGTTSPSIVLFRRSADHRPHKRLALLLNNLSAIEEPLLRGAIVILEKSRLRIRTLPISDAQP